MGYILKHTNYEKDKEKLDNSVLKEVVKKEKTIEKDQFQNKGHLLSGPLAGFRSEHVSNKTFKIIFSYCGDCRRHGRNPNHIGKCDFCESMPDDSVMYWMVYRHKDGERDVYNIATKFLTELFPPPPQEDEKK